MQDGTYRLRDYVLLFALAAIWGSSFLFIKLAVASLPPMTLVAARLWIAALGLLAYLLATGGSLPRNLANWRDFAVIAVLGNLLPFFLISWGELSIDSGMAAILMATMPLVTLTLAHAFTPDDRITPAKLLGLAVGFGGIVVLVGPGVLAGLGREVVAQLAVAAAAWCYGMSSVYTRWSTLKDLPAASTAGGVLVCAALMALPFALAVDRPWTLSPTAGALWSLLALALLCTSVAYLILFRLLAATRATFVANINYLVPVFGVFWGTALLGETIGLTALAALALILLGIGLAEASARRARRRAAAGNPARAVVGSTSSEDRE